MKDQRTKDLINSFGNFNQDDIIEWDWKKIKEKELIEFDSYRLFHVFSEIYGDNGKVGDKGIMNESIAKYQLEELNKNNAKMFILQDHIKHLLLLTKPSKIKEELKLPFESLFIDFNYIDEDNQFKLFGIYLSFISKDLIKNLNQTFSKITNKEPPFKEGNAVSISTLMFNKEKGLFIFVDTILDLSTGKLIKPLKIEGLDSKPDKYNKIINNFMITIVTNLLLLLNEPRVVIYIQERNNERRMKKGLIPIPSLLKTKIHVDLNNYIEKIYFNGLSHSKLGFSFWVRGHWRTFKSLRYINKKGQKIWITPHLVGEGLTPPQIFEVTNA